VPRLVGAGLGGAGRRRLSKSCDGSCGFVGGGWEGLSGVAVVLAI
jgi:hypothetical protein